jgi:hypothetical protein
MAVTNRTAACLLFWFSLPAALVGQPEITEQKPLEVLLTVTPALSEAGRTAMTNEAAAIWRAQGVIIEWLPPTAVRPVSKDRLRALIVEKRHIASTPGEPFTIGELVKPLNGHAVAMVSIASAQRLVASVRGRAGYDLIAVDQRRLGVVLGRALAHEIGHFLLDTHTHARSGLMRPQFDALEFTDMRDGAFALDRDAAQWLRSRDIGKFAYIR